MNVVWTILAAVLVIVIADAAFRRFACRKIQGIFENVPPFGVVAAKTDPNAQKLSIRTTDGLTLAGSLIMPAGGRPRTLVLFFPELNGNHGMAPHYCQALIDDGHAVLGFDFRNQGASDSQAGYSPIHWVTEYEMRDVAAVLEFVESHPTLSTLPLTAFGVSRGGVAALVAACRYPRIRAVIAESAFGTNSRTKRFVRRFGRYVIPERSFDVLPDWHIALTLRQTVARSQIARNCEYVHIEQEAVYPDRSTAVLLISGSRDSYVTPDVAKDLARCFGGEDCLWIVEHAKHNSARSASPAEYDARITQHMAQVTANSSIADKSTVLIHR